MNNPIIERGALEYVRKHPDCTGRDLATHAGISLQEAFETLYALYFDGLVNRVVHLDGTTLFSERVIK